MEDAAPRADIFVTATGNVDVITRRSHARHEGPRHRLQHRPLRQRDPGRRPQELQVAQRQAAGRRDRVPRRQAHHPAVGRPAGEPRQRHGPSELRDVGVVHQPDAGADRAVATNPGKYEKKVYTLPKHLDEKVARLHLDKIGVKLTKLSDKQAEYINIPGAGPVQAGHLSLLRTSPYRRGARNPSTASPDPAARAWPTGRHRSKGNRRHAYYKREGDHERAQNAWPGGDVGVGGLGRKHHSRRVVPTSPLPGTLLRTLSRGFQPRGAPRLMGLPIYIRLFMAGGSGRGFTRRHPLF